MTRQISFCYQGVLNIQLSELVALRLLFQFVSDSTPKAMILMNNSEGTIPKVHLS